MTRGSTDFVQMASPALARPWWADRVIQIVIELNQRLGTLAFFASLGAVASVAYNHGGWKLPGGIAFAMAWLFGVIGALAWVWPVVPSRHRRQGRGMVVFAIILVVCMLSLRESKTVRRHLAEFGAIAQLSFYHPS